MSKDSIQSSHTANAQIQQIETPADTYGDNFQSHLLDQYKLCVEMADRVSARRGQANTFYISLLSALLALLSFIVNTKIYSGSQTVLFIFTSMLGTALCFTWYINIQSYKQLNSLKYQVISEIEQQLPFPCYSREWDILKANQARKKTYSRLTAVEKSVPIIFAVPYVGIFFYSLFNLLGLIK